MTRGLFYLTWINNRMSIHGIYLPEDTSKFVWNFYKTKQYSTVRDMCLFFVRNFIAYDKLDWIVFITKCLEYNGVTMATLWEWIQIHTSFFFVFFFCGGGGGGGVVVKMLKNYMPNHLRYRRTFCNKHYSPKCVVKVVQNEIWRSTCIYLIYMLNMMTVDGKATLQAWWKNTFIHFFIGTRRVYQHHG